MLKKKSSARVAWQTEHWSIMPKVLDRNRSIKIFMLVSPFGKDRQPLPRVSLSIETPLEKSAVRNRH